MNEKRLTNILLHMKDRCYNPNHKEFSIYGGRGIKVCKEWYTPHSRKGSKAFKKWALQNGYADNLTIDRIDNNKGYSPENCRWVTMEVQQNNKRNNRLITYKGKTQTMAQWSKELNIPFSTIKGRLNRHLPVEKVLSNYNLSCERYLNPEERQKTSISVKKFMSDPVKKERWLKTLSKRQLKKIRSK